jgi:hypothetical protein
VKGYQAAQVVGTGNGVVSQNKASLMTARLIQRPECSKRTEYLETSKLHAEQCECSKPGHCSAAHVVSSTLGVVVNKNVPSGTRI